MWKGALGRSGVTRDKREGDGATPAGVQRLVGVLYRPDRVRCPVTRLPVAAIRRDDGWCDDPNDRRYLIDYYRDDIMSLASLLNRDLSSWLT